MEELQLTLTDTEYETSPTTHVRNIVRAIVMDRDKLLFVSVERDDEFGKASYIETSGGGVETGEDLVSAIRRELREELGIEVLVICKLGVVTDDYNLIGRHNVNNYFLCQKTKDGEKHLTDDEINRYHLKPLRLSFDEAIETYEKSRETKIGRLVYQREMPILLCAKKMIDRAKKHEN